MATSLRHHWGKWRSRAVCLYPEAMAFSLLSSTSEWLRVISLIIELWFLSWKVLYFIKRETPQHKSWGLYICIYKQARNIDKCGDFEEWDYMLGWAIMKNVIVEEAKWVWLATEMKRPCQVWCVLQPWLRRRGWPSLRTRPMTGAQKRRWENHEYPGNSRWAQLEHYMLAMGTFFMLNKCQSWGISRFNSCAS